MFNRLIRLIGRQIPLFRSVAEFRQDPHRINRLQGRILACEGPRTGVFAVFPLEQGNLDVVRNHLGHRGCCDMLLG